MTVEPTNLPQEYVPIGGYHRELEYQILDEEEAIENVISFLRQRITRVLDSRDSPPAILLSGGIDSILVTMVAHEIAPHLQAVTFFQPASQESIQEIESAQRLCSQLGINHTVVSPQGEEYVALLRETMTRLGTTEPWEVMAGATLLAMSNRFPHHVLLTGAGADALFLGGKELDFDFSHPEYESLWLKEVIATVNSQFVRERFIPDFYERLLPYPDNHIQLWQDMSAVDMATKIHPHLVRGKDGSGDKIILREAARALGAPEDIVSRKKSPLQKSSGALEAIVSHSRSFLNDHYKGKTYSQPLNEGLEWTVARLELLRLSRFYH